MFKIILKLIDLNSELFLFIRLQVNVLIMCLELFVILRIVLLEVGLLLFELNASLCKLLSQLLNIRSRHAEATSQSQIRLALIQRPGPRSLALKLHLHADECTLNVLALFAQALNLLATELFEAVKFTSELALVLLDF